MPNEISAETREADARWCESTAFGRDTEHDHSDLERCTGCQRINRLATLSRGAVKREAAIAKLKEALADTNEQKTSAVEWLEFGSLQRAFENLYSVAREVVGGEP